MSIKTHKQDEIKIMAGFFDGEGCIGAYTDSKGICRLLISMAQIEWETLERFRRAVGGLGAVYGPFDESKQPARLKTRALAKNPRPVRPNYRYQAGSDDAIKVFKLIRPYLGAFKREDGDTAIAKFEAYREKKRNEKLLRQSKAA